MNTRPDTVVLLPKATASASLPPSRGPCPLVLPGLAGASHHGPLSWDTHQPVLVSLRFAHSSVNVLSLNSLQPPF